MRPAPSSRRLAVRKTARPGSAQQRRRQTRATYDHATRIKPAASLRGSDGCAPLDEISRQDDIHREALAIIDATRTSLHNLAHQSQQIRSIVSCDQEDWPAIIRDHLEDMLGDTFGCLPDAIERARRESRSF